jgi:hypothetical protein
MVCTLDFAAILYLGGGFDSVKGLKTNFTEVSGGLCKQSELLGSGSYGTQMKSWPCLGELNRLRAAGPQLNRTTETVPHVGGDIK